MGTCDMAAKLKAMEMSISDGFLVHFIMTSLPSHYSPFTISYNTQKTKWNIAELTSYCVEEEERQKTEKMKDMANFVNFGKGKNQAESGWSKQSKQKFKVSKNEKNTQKNTQKSGIICSFCKSHGHMQKECTGFKERMKRSRSRTLKKKPKPQLMHRTRPVPPFGYLPAGNGRRLRAL